MKIYQDVFTGEELLSDVYKYKSDFDGAIWKVQSFLQAKENVGNVDIGCGNEFGGGEEQAGDEPVEKVLNLEYGFGLTQYIFENFKDLMAYLKPFVGKVTAHLTESGNPDRAAAFKAAMNKFALDFIKVKFEDITFYTGSKETLDGSLVLSFWEDESASGPTFYYFADALREIKC